MKIFSWLVSGNRCWTADRLAHPGLGFAPVPGRGNYPHDDRGAMFIAKIGCCLGAQQDEGCEIADLVDAGANLGRMWRMCNYCLLENARLGLSCCS